MDTELERIVNKAIAYLKEGEEQEPLCLAYKQDKPLEAMGFQVPEDGKERIKMWAQLAMTVALSGGDKAIIITEGWMLDIKEGEPMTKPSQSSKRVECLTINQICKDKSGDALIAIPFYRNNMGVEIKEQIRTEADGIGGDTHDVFRKVFDTSDQMTLEIVNSFKKFLEARGQDEKD